MIQELPVYGLPLLKDVVKFLQNPSSFEPQQNSSFSELPLVAPAVDFCDIKGQAHVKRALEIAAEGSHNIVLSRPPGCGKTLMAHCLGLSLH